MINRRGPAPHNITYVAQYYIDDLCTTLGANHFSVWHAVAKQLDILGTSPLAIDLLFLMHHEIVDNAINGPLPVDAHLVRTSAVGV